MPKAEASRIIERARSEGRKVLTEAESKELIALYGVPTTRIKVARSPDEAVKAAKEIGFPVVLKVLSPDITHKTDVGGVVVDVKTEAEVVRAYNSIMDNVAKNAPGAKVLGVTVQEMLPQATEVIVGVVKDPSFGHALMFGLGGIFVEVLKDVAFTPVPVTPEDADELIRSIKGYPLLRGYRRSPPRDVDALKELIVKVSDMVLDLEEDISEMDLNPIFVYEPGKGCKVVDARIILT